MSSNWSTLWGFYMKVCIVYNHNFARGCSTCKSIKRLFYEMDVTCLASHPSTPLH